MLILKTLIFSNAEPSEPALQNQTFEETLSEGFLVTLSLSDKVGPTRIN